MRNLGSVYRSTNTQERRLGLGEERIPTKEENTDCPFRRFRNLSRSSWRWPWGMQKAKEEEDEVRMM